MKQLLLFAGAAALFSVTPAQAQPAYAGHGARGCPPGLAKKGCIPPGQAKKLFEQGQRVPHGYSGWTPYDRLPYELRRNYSLNDNYRYIYRDEYLYRVDPTTMIVREVLRAVL